MNALDQAAVAPVAEMAQRVRANVGSVIVGKDEAIDLALVTLLCEGHALIEDVPGLGKTTLAKALARSIGCTFRRIQFTPDLLPSDVTGISFFNQRLQEFEFRPGPLFANVVLADEINRATPRTQSALLESMQERQVTVDGESMAVPRPFLVLATQNPIELEGTFPLPEAQLDRFLLKISLGYPSMEDEKVILRRFRADDPLIDLAPVVSDTQLLEMRSRCRAVYVNGDVEDYLVRLVRATREHGDIELGVSPRGTLALYHAAQAMAAMRGRGYVLPDDVKRLAPAVLSHRLIVSPNSRLRANAPRDVMCEILCSLPVPVEPNGVNDHAEAEPARAI